MQNAQDRPIPSFVCYSGDGCVGTLTSLTLDGRWQVSSIPVVEETQLAVEKKPIFLHFDNNKGVLLLDPVTKEIRVDTHFPKDAIAAYAYRDVLGQRMWYMNDGDKETGNDVLNCGDNGASVTVVTQPENKVLATLCVGRGHHVTTFVGPSKKWPQLPKRAFVSNLVDGTISVIANDDMDAENFLKILYVINLFDTKKEGMAPSMVPNNAFPHGMIFSEHTGKLYNLNNGYHTIAVINPETNQVEDAIEMPTSSNLLGNPSGRYLIGKGVDRKSDTAHVQGCLSVFDTETKTIENAYYFPDIYPSTYRFNPDGSKLYVTTASTGKGVQRDNIKTNLLYIFDTTRLPAMSVSHVIEVGQCDCGRRPIAFVDDGSGSWFVLVPNLTEGTLTIFNGDTDDIISTLVIGNKNATEFSFSFWEAHIYGA